MEGIGVVDKICKNKVKWRHNSDSITPLNRYQAVDVPEGEGVELQNADFLLLREQIEDVQNELGQLTEIIQRLQFENTEMS